MNRVFRKGIALISVLALLTACTAYKPQSIELPDNLPESFTTHIEATSPEASLNKWWESFGDSKLNALMKETFSNNLSLAQAYARLDRLLAVTRSTAATRRPFFNLAGEASRTKQPGVSGDITGSNYTLSVAAGYELDLWRKLDFRTKAATLDADASREEVMSLYLTLSAQLADLYYLSVEQRAQLNLTDRTITSYEDILERVERRYKEGLVPALDIYQARQNLASAKASRPVFEANLAVAEHAISTILGHYPKQGITGELDILPEKISTFKTGIPSEILAHRPDIQAAFLRLKASDARIAAAIADRFPSFNLLGSYGSSSTALAAGDISGIFWSVLVSIAEPILDGGKRQAEVDRSRAVFKEHLANYHQTVLNAFKEVEDVLINNYTTEKRIAQLEKTVEATEASLRLSTDRYLQGLSDYFPVLTAQTFHFDAQAKLLAAQRQLLSDRISLARALGGNWMDMEAVNRFTTQSKGQDS
ncbi:MAG: efflux transporter outer membrane subunit [Thermodesulfobacteriota bacterium]